MSTRPPCLETKRLGALLEGTLTLDEETLLIAHLDSCATCRDELDQQVAASGLPAGMKPRQGGATSQHETELRRVIDTLQRHPDASSEPTSSIAPVVQDHAEPQATLPCTNREDQTQEDRESGPDPITAERTPVLPSAANQLTSAERHFLEPSDDPQSLGRFGAYEVLGLVGRGGMGIVYKAYDASLKRVVAVKVLAPALASEALARRRFIREAQAAAAICHPNVVNIHAVDEVRGLPYLVMQFVSGQSLQEKLERFGPIGVTEILRIGIQIAAGLGAAHAQGLVHRDIKPSNILLENGVERIKITDFGLARAVGESTLTDAGTVAGTPAYMSPEQARGDPVDERTDLFSLGSVLYAMATGRAPFRAEKPMAVLRKVIDDEPRPIPSRNPEVPDWLVATIAKLMAKNPRERFASAAELAEFLAAHLAERQHPSPQGLVKNPEPRAPTVPAKPGRLWLTTLSLVVTGCVLSVLFIVWASGLLRRAHLAAPRDGSQAQSNIQPGRRPSADSPVSNTVLFNLGRAREFLAKGQYTEAIGRYDVILRLDSSNTEAYTGRALASFGLGQVDNAIADLNRALELSPKNAEALHARGSAYVKKHEYKKAVADFTEAIHLDPEHSPAYSDRGLVHNTLKEWDLAINDFTEAIRVNPGYAWAHARRAAAYRAKGNPPRALADWSEAIQRAPSKASFYFERGAISMELEDWDHAIEDFDQVAKLDPSDRRVLAALGKAHRAKGHLATSLTYCNEAVRSSPNSPWCYLERALTYRELRDWDHAFADFDEVIRLDPSIWSAYCNRGVGYRARGEFEKALSEMNKAVEISPNDFYNFLERGTTYREMANHAAAKADFTKAIELNPKFPWSYSGRGLAETELEEWDLAIRDFGRAIDLAPVHGFLFAHRGRAYLAKGEFEQAIRDFDESLRRDYGPAEVYDNRALARAKLGNAQGAEEDREKAAALRAAARPKPAS
ncbi:MAG TPA: tetratricopeptide repeat protein [Isosphaeraceae bacterium]|nr:tetratricopeptide repeat protein [Isosphaeraceae bacterium]